MRFKIEQRSRYVGYRCEAEKYWAVMHEAPAWKEVASCDTEERAAELARLLNAEAGNFREYGKVALAPKSWWEIWK